MLGHTSQRHSAAVQLDRFNDLVRLDLPVWAPGHLLPAEVLVHGALVELEVLGELRDGCAVEVGNEQLQQVWFVETGPAPPTTAVDPRSTRCRT
jgi:hypothetical protein